MNELIYKMKMKEINKEIREHRKSINWLSSSNIAMNYSSKHRGELRRQAETLLNKALIKRNLTKLEYKNKK